MRQRVVPVCLQLQACSLRAWLFPYSLYCAAETDAERAKREETEEEQEILKTKVMKTALMTATEIAQVGLLIGTG